MTSEPEAYMWQSDRMQSAVAGNSHKGQTVQHRGEERLELILKTQEAELAVKRTKVMEERP